MSQGSSLPKAGQERKPIYAITASGVPGGPEAGNSCFLGNLGFRPTVASEVGRPTPRRTTTILPGSRCAAGGLKECRGLPASARGTMPDGAAVGAVGGSDRAAPSHGASARRQGPQGDADNPRGRISRHIVPTGLPPRVQRAQAGFLLAEKVPFLRGHLPGARPGSAGRGRWNRTGPVVWFHRGFSPPIGSGTRRMRTSTPSGRAVRSCADFEANWQGSPRMLNALIAYGDWQNGVFLLESCQAGCME